MRRDLAGAVRLLVVPTLVVVGVVVFFPGRAALGLRIYALFLCAVALGLAFAALRRAYPATSPLRPTTKHTAPRRSSPASLARIEHETALGVASTFDLHFRLRPRLRAIAAGLLVTRRGISLDADSAAVARILGDETWALVRRGPGATPEDRLARGIPVTDLRRVVESLEHV